MNKKGLMIVIVLLLGLMSGCMKQKSEELLAIGQVAIISSTGDDFSVSLKLLSSEKFENVSVVTTDASSNYRSTITPTKVVYLDNDPKAIYTYLIKLQFLEPTVMKKITLQLDDKIADFDVGYVETVSLNKELTTVAKNADEHIDVLQLIDVEYLDSYIKPARITLRINNKSINVVNIKDITFATKPQGVDLRLVKIIKQDPILVSASSKDYAYIYFDNTKENLLYTSFIVKVTYEYLGETFDKYVTVDHGYTDALQTSAILEMKIHEKALLPGVVRAKNVN